jgi:hypothetical protein
MGYVGEQIRGYSSVVTVDSMLLDDEKAPGSTVFIGFRNS